MHNTFRHERGCRDRIFTIGRVQLILVTSSKSLLYLDKPKLVFCNEYSFSVLFVDTNVCGSFLLRTNFSFCGQYISRSMSLISCRTLLLWQNLKTMSPRISVRQKYWLTAKHQKRKFSFDQWKQTYKKRICFINVQGHFRNHGNEWGSCMNQ